MRVGAILSYLVGVLASTTANKTHANCNPACSKNETCETKSVQCVTYPCNPISTCVTKPMPEPKCTLKCPEFETCRFDALDNSQICLSPCATVRCGSGYTCVTEKGKCNSPQCPPVARCKLVN
ncbi:hypothetical protein CCR75_002212 [Bremia lactucae]|uniref:TIL domain-containing protein n=1 Tax=Bremia lactucae TaxID=4779 RepID=A0A976FP11_BRELC|nr:hypothetical protein CCR75_002212 [Bremia lactucae]